LYHYVLIILGKDGVENGRHAPSELSGASVPALPLAARALLLLLAPPLAALKLLASLSLLLLFLWLLLLALSLAPTLALLLLPPRLPLALLLASVLPVVLLDVDVFVPHLTHSPALSEFPSSLHPAALVLAPPQLLPWLSVVVAAELAFQPALLLRVEAPLFPLAPPRALPVRLRPPPVVSTSVHVPFFIVLLLSLPEVLVSATALAGQLLLLLGAAAGLGLGLAPVQALVELAGRVPLRPGVVGQREGGEGEGESDEQEAVLCESHG
jgi:hypothetical protein